MGKLSDDEKEWRAKSDARTLAESQEILADKSRLNAARSHARKEASALDRVLKMGGAERPAREAPRPAKPRAARETKERAKEPMKAVEKAATAKPAIRPRK